MTEMTSLVIKKNSVDDRKKTSVGRLITSVNVVLILLDAEYFNAGFCSFAFYFHRNIVAQNEVVRF